MASKLGLGANATSNGGGAGSFNTCGGIFPGLGVGTPVGVTVEADVVVGMAVGAGGLVGNGVRVEVGVKVDVGIKVEVAVEVLVAVAFLVAVLVGGMMTAVGASVGVSTIQGGRPGKPQVGPEVAVGHAGSVAGSHPVWARTDSTIPNRVIKMPIRAIITNTMTYFLDFVLFLLMLVILLMKANSRSYRNRSSGPQCYMYKLLQA
jgi:hypothetical protein